MPAPARRRAARPRVCDSIGGMGFNPFRKHRRRAADIFLVAGALILTAALVAWAFLGG